MILIWSVENVLLRRLGKWKGSHNFCPMKTQKPGLCAPGKILEMAQVPHSIVKRGSLGWHLLFLISLLGYTCDADWRCQDIVWLLCLLMLGMWQTMASLDSPVSALCTRAPGTSVDSEGRLFVVFHAFAFPSQSCLAGQPCSIQNLQSKMQECGCLEVGSPQLGGL